METTYKRRKTRPVRVGGTVIGGDSPVVVQTMTNTPTMDVAATAAQIERCVAAGATVVRMTAQTATHAAALAGIRKLLDEKGVKVDLVADIHFNPDAAFEAARHVEKVRINPGNFAETSGQSDDYNRQLEEIESKFVKFLDICRQHGTAVRLGVNHGSLSERIMSRYGDTPEGMVESALEYLRIARRHDFNDIVISIKASNVTVMTQTVRLLVEKMAAEGMDYPLHLGVTEAGDGEDGRVKSAVGIGSLLADGIGDTIRVSLSEAPEAELPVARAILAHIERIAAGCSFVSIETFSERQDKEPYPLVVGYDTPAPVGKTVTASYPADMAADAVTVAASIDLGRILLSDDSVDSISIDAPSLTDEQRTSLSLNILQATRRRISKTEFIACPGCGRTLFDLPSTLARVKKATGHLKGLKIAVMGCIVNGPGEMADADYGYVGGAKGRVSVYRGRECVVRNITPDEAVDRLIGLIRADGRWREPDTSGKA